MRKRIASFATGWGGDIVEQFYKGLVEGLKDYEADVYLFMVFPLYSDTDAFREGELNLYNLPDYKEFDGAIILANGLDFPGSYDTISRHCLEAGIPTISVSKNTDDFYYIGSENRSGMIDLCEHLITRHGVKKITFIAGAMENNDCRVRYEAIADTCRKYNIPFDESNIVETFWAPAVAADYVKDHVRSGKPLPDAFICANDSLAMTVCEALNEVGLHAPEDALVTGYDFGYFSRSYDPALSTVCQNLDEIGIVTAHSIMDIISGKQRPKKQVVASTFKRGESCGCKTSKDVRMMRRTLGTVRYHEHMLSSLFDGQFSSIESQFLHKEYYSELKPTLTKAYEHSNFIEKGFLQIMLDPLFEKSSNNPDVKLRVKGYSPTMDPVCVQVNGKSEVFDSIKTTDLLAKYPEDGKNHIFIFSPLHEEEKAYGYYVLMDLIEDMNTNFAIQRYKDKLNAVFMKFKSDITVRKLTDKLIEITETDALTHVKSRNSYVNMLKEIEHSIIAQSGKIHFAIGMFDINNLKYVNDTIGHDGGDEYIINCCRLICSAFAHSPVYRIGGDEFVAILRGDDYDRRFEILSDFKTEMELIASQDLPAVNNISIASGIAVFDPEIDKSIEDVVKRADTLMYEDKAIMKNGNIR